MLPSWTGQDDVRRRLDLQNIFGVPYPDEIRMKRAHAMVRECNVVKCEWEVGRGERPLGHLRTATWEQLPELSIRYPAHLWFPPTFRDQQSPGPPKDSSEWMALVKPLIIISWSEVLAGMTWTTRSVDSEGNGPAVTNKQDMEEWWGKEGREGIFTFHHGHDTQVTDNLNHWCRSETLRMQKMRRERSDQCFA